MDEFAFIAQYLAGIAGPEALDLKDDAALWSPPKGMDAVMSLDTIIEGVHFPVGKFDAEIARKLLRVNISDMVAKGAKPLGYLLSLTLPKSLDIASLESFCAGLAQDQHEFDVRLWGGDTTRSIHDNCVLSITMIGALPVGQIVRRAGAHIGDAIYVSGHIGEAYLGLKIIKNQIDMKAYETDGWLEKYHIPCPPFAQIEFIRRYASAALDISDGLVADAQHLADQSNMCLEIDLREIPLSEATQSWLADQPDTNNALVKLVTGGDDYQVLMCAPKSLAEHTKYVNSGFTKIGRVTQGNGVKTTGCNGKLVEISQKGYTHF
jgi:thiamine-monophosphate kinase